MNVIEFFKKIFRLKKEKNFPEKKAESPKPIVIKRKTEFKRELSNTSAGSIVKEIKVATIRAQNKARNSPTRTLRGMPKRHNAYQGRLWYNRGEIDRKGD